MLLPRARRQAAQADLLVVNHALLLSDLALRQQTDNYTAAAVLPPFDRIILDEAHHLEDVATSFFSAQVTRFAFARVLNKLRHPRKPDKGLLPRFLSSLARQLPETEPTNSTATCTAGSMRCSPAARRSSTGRCPSWRRSAAELAAALGREVGEREELRHRVVPPFTKSDTWDETVKARVRELAAGTGALGQRRAGAAEGLRADSPRRSPTSSPPFSPTCAAPAGAWRRSPPTWSFFVAGDESTCAWFEVARRQGGRGSGPITRLCAAPLEVAA